MAPHLKDVVCGKLVDDKAPNFKNQVHGVYRYGSDILCFHAKECKEKFEANPNSYYLPFLLWKASHFRDPVCGKEMDHQEAINAFPRGTSMPNNGFGFVRYNNETFYFCSPNCKKNFESEPKNYYDNYRKWSGERTEQLSRRVESEGVQKLVDFPDYDPYRDLH